MLKQTLKIWALVAAFGLAAPAQAMTFQLGVEVTFASGGNPLGASIGTTSNAGTGDIGSQVVTGIGFEEPTLNPAAGVGADIALTIGNIVFRGDDDIEGFLDNGVPAMIFDGGVFLGLDYVILFEISGTEAIGKDFDSSDLGQDTSSFLSTQHYWADFTDDGSFVIGTVTGFDQFFDDEDQVNFLGPIIGDVLVTGNVFVTPEPGLAVLAGAALLGLAMVRRR